MPDKAFETSQSQDHTGALLKQTVKDLPNAALNLLDEVGKNPLGAAEHAAKVVGESAGIGLLLGALVPSKGMAEIGAGVVFAIPMVAGEVARFRQARSEANTSGANVDKVAQNYAKGLVSDGTDIGLGFIGGGIGGHFGNKLATADSVIGNVAQSSQRGILGFENNSLKSVKDVAPIKPIVNRAFSTRIAQLDTEAAAPKYNTYVGSLHGHSYFSDGTNSPAEDFASAKNGGMDFYAITDHNHDAARGGIDPKDPRTQNESGIPIIAADPAEYVTTMQQASQAAEDGKFVPFVGNELGTIGSRSNHPADGGNGVGDGGGHGGHSADDSHGPSIVTEPNGQKYTFMRVTEPDGSVHAQVYSLDGSRPPQSASSQLQEITKPAPRALNADDAQQKAIQAAADRDQSHWGGINHSIILELPKTFIRTIRNGNPLPAHTTGNPDVINVMDGDFKTLDAKLSTIKDSTGNAPIMIAAHPRFAQDWDPNLPDALRGRDYGIKSYPSVDAWLKGIGQRYVGIETVKGEALNPNNVDTMKPFDYDPLSYAGYLDKGLKVGPYYGRDDHFGIPAERPAGSGILATSLDKNSLMEGMRARRVFSTTNKSLLRGYMTANNDSVMMGQTLDENAVHNLNINMHLDGTIDPKAQYKVSLYGDPSVGDGQLAAPVQVKQLSGQDILDTQGNVAFDQVQHTLGNNSLWYTEVQRMDQASGNTDYMLTSPIWVGPQGSAARSIISRGIVGVGTNFITGTK